MGKKRANQPGYVKAKGKDGRTIWVPEQKQLNVKQKLIPVKNLNQGEPVELTKFKRKNNRNRELKIKNINKNSTNTYNGEMGLDNPGFSHGYYNGAVIKYDYREDMNSHLDSDGYSRHSIITDVELDGYSPSVHAKIILDNMPMVEEDVQSFLLGMHTYTKSSFNQDDWYGYGQSGYYGEEFRLDPPNENIQVLYKIATAANEERLQMISEKIGVDITGSKPESFKISQLSNLVVSGESDDNISSVSDINVEVPLGVAKRTEEGLEFLWGKETVDHALTISGNDDKEIVLYVLD